ncbi:unnamed protein product [Blepharisma stoltei]|uniref:Uncharacterized protein n=1 Tax=Blepharisma stoltei TaxID=1481888 RepID=A0AAU9K6C5_9CILI|nr:unnamed protein product [Blepharisma stoltei]
MAVIMGKLSDLCNDTSFSITFENHFICHACSSITKCNEISESIVVPRNNCNSIQDTLENLREPKIFYGDNKLYCERCDQPRDITIETEGIDWPSTISFYFPSHNNRRIEINEELNIEGIIAILFNKITFIWLYVFSSTTFSLSNSPSATFG